MIRRKNIERERDRIWCFAIIDTLSVEDMQKVTKRFIELRTTLKMPHILTPIEEKE